MVKTLKVLLYLTLFLCLYSLTIFFVPPRLYAPWAAGGLISLILFAVLMVKVLPSRKRRLKMRALVREYETMQTREYEAREAGMSRELTCPACGTANSFWSFLEKGACPQCASTLWSTILPNQGEEYLEIFRRVEEIDQFHKKLSPSLLRKVKAAALKQDL